tara:strand:+ start:189 stop:2033 length:1845 start_codon:yes stop_codon:yes gene_type:complete
MKENSRIHLEIFLISLFIFLPKWICSYYLFPSEEFLIKTILDIKDVQYFLNVVSLSNLDLTPSFNEFIEPEKIITFPFFSIIFHSFVYKIIGYSSFIILEFLFIFFSILIFYKILQELKLNKAYSLLVLAIYFSLPFILNILSKIELSQFSILQNLVSDFIGSRFPRPLVTNIFFLLGIYFLLKLQKEFVEKRPPLSIISISLVMVLMVNSFFYFFLIQGLSTLILLLAYEGKNLITYILNYKKIIIKSLIISVTGLTIFVLQSFVGENDYSNRMSVFSVDLSDKIFLIKYFFLSLFRIEIICLALISFLLFFYAKMRFNQKNNQINLFFIFIISSFFSSIFFIALSSKMVSLYQFANIFLFSFILLIFILSVMIIDKTEFLKNLLTKYRYVIYSLLFCLGIIFSFSNLTNKNERENFAKVNNEIKDLKFNNLDLYLLTNNLNVQASWLFNGFKNIYLTNGFNNSLSDYQIENTFSKVLKNTFKEDSAFEEIIKYQNKADRNRNSIISYFLNYKYQANSIRIFGDKDDFTIEEQKKIEDTSPLRSQMHILPNSEKTRLIKIILQQKNKIEVKKLLVIIDKKSWPSNFNLQKSINKKFNIIIDNENYFIAKTNFK